MKDEAEDMTWFEAVSRLACGGSLLITAFSFVIMARCLIERGWWDYYDWFWVALGFLAQMAALVFAVALPMGVLRLRKRLKFSKTAWWLLAAAAAGVAIEVAAMLLMPSRGTC
jgi:hypothetical protein